MHGIFFLLSEILIVEINLKGRPRDQLIIVTLLLNLACLIFLSVLINDDFNFLMKRISLLLIHINWKIL